MHIKTLILGAGLTGLSTAYHLQQFGESDYLVVDRAEKPGGLCASQEVKGFTFDYSGHLLHLHSDYGKKLVKKLLKNNLLRLKRKAFIYTGSSRIPFPFQANLFALPPEQRQACVKGLLEANSKIQKKPSNFEQWCLQRFGKPIYEQFMRPYNTKLWECSPKELTCEWCGPFVPSPSRKEILQSAQKPLKKSYGYNVCFYYPKQGGCGALANALAKELTGLRTKSPVTQINLKNKTARFGRKKVFFENLVNTLPLPVFLKLLEKEPRLTALSDRLAHTSVNVYNLALKKEIKPFSWIYFPDEQDPFYRVGLQSGFSPRNAPDGTSSLYIELPGSLPQNTHTEKRIWEALLQKGIINKDDKVLFSFWQRIPYAYALYDKRRAQTVSRAINALKKAGCFCAGRYGKWEYSFMESSLLEGLELAKKLI